MSTESATKSMFSKKLSSRLAIVGLGLVVLWFFTSLGSGNLLKAGTPAPDWELKEPNVSSGRLSLSELKGKVVVLDFWSLGCPPCMKMTSELDSVARELKSKDVAVVGVSTWGESRTDVFRTKKNRKLFYHLVVGKQQMIQAYRVSSLPTLYILDKQGKIASSHTGFMPRQKLKEAVLRVLDK